MGKKDEPSARKGTARPRARTPRAPRQAGGKEATVRVRFQFRHGGAASVALAGDFNGWSTTADPMERGDPDVWVLEVALAPGRHEYKYVVDGTDWRTDPEAPTVPNVWGSESSCVDVG
jgi:1,4-alpha-glucan branching enzyme